MSHNFTSIFISIFPSLKALRELIRNSDAQIISSRGRKVLRNDAEQEQVEEAVKKFKEDSEFKGRDRNHILVDL